MLPTAYFLTHRFRMIDTACKIACRFASDHDFGTNRLDGPDQKSGSWLLSSISDSFTSILQAAALEDARVRSCHT